MKNFPIFFCMIIFLLATLQVSAQDVRVKCGDFTINVPSSNVKCYKTDDNIPIGEDASPDDLSQAQIANTSIYFSDYEYTKSDIDPQVTLYLIEDMGRTSFSFLDVAAQLTGEVNMLSSGSADITNVFMESPFMPYQSAESKFRALPAFLSFENGGGIRCITSFQDTISSSGSSTNLYYSFQGITYDGRYYISGVFPLQSSFLSGQNVSNIDKNKIDAGNFRPSLDQLDYFIRSIVIE